MAVVGVDYGNRGRIQFDHAARDQMNTGLDYGQGSACRTPCYPARGDASQFARVTAGISHRGLQLPPPDQSHGGNMFYNVQPPPGAHILPGGEAISRRSTANGAAIDIPPVIVPNSYSAANADFGVSTLLTQCGSGNMENTMRSLGMLAPGSIPGGYTRSWNIQSSLDQHAALCRQRDTLAETTSEIVKVRKAQVQFAKLELEPLLQRARQQPSQTEQYTPAQLQELARQIRKRTQELAVATEICKHVEPIAKSLLNSCDKEIEKSRLEMKELKQAIDDKAVVPVAEGPPPPTDPNRQYFYCTDCKVGGHGQRFCEYLLRRPSWRIYPNHKWFMDEKNNVYHCPLGKRLVDFADETHFSRLAMYLKGRGWLEDKTKIFELAPDLMPETFIIKNKEWVGTEPNDENRPRLPWFLKEADRNWGTSIHICAKASELMSLAEPQATYVVQQHIKDPLLMDDGRKSHIKFYVLAMCKEDGQTWQIYTYRDGYLSISPKSWSPDDLTKDTQVTIIRSQRIGEWKHWQSVYPKCKEGVAEVMRRAVGKGKIEGRLQKRQFEIFSADYIVDTHGEVWLFEFNMSPVLKDPRTDPNCNDGAMILSALDIVVPHEGSDPGFWDLAAEIVGPLPLVEPPRSASPAEGEKQGDKDAAVKTPCQENNDQ